MNSKELVLWLPWKAPNLNDLIRMKGSRYRGAYNRVKKLWATRVCEAARQIDAFAPALPVARFTLHYHVVEPDMRRDPANVCSGAEKFCSDGLIKAGVIAGDGWKHVQGVTYSWSVDREQPGVRVTVTAVEAA